MAVLRFSHYRKHCLPQALCFALSWIVHIIAHGVGLLATLPRHIGETLAQINGLRVLPCPIAIPSFTVKQHWHARYHNESGNLWLRGVCASLFMDRKVRGAPAKTKRNSNGL